MINLKIDPEFQSQIMPLTDDEFQQLEENILKEGKLLSPLIVWNIAIVCGFNRKFYKQRNSQQPVCDMQFTVVANESNRELRWQGASYSGTHPVFILSPHQLFEIQPSAF